MQCPNFFVIVTDNSAYKEILHQTRLNLIISEGALRQQMKDQYWDGSLESFAEANEITKATDGESADINAACARNNVAGCEGVIYVQRKSIIGKIPDWIEDMCRALKDPTGRYAYH
ncbi:hypothetical protein MANI_030434 [Metarhizium anisopliae]|nr:hypothetical protein MANI_030434 [Metarhizium anisopliae]